MRFGIALPHFNRLSDAESIGTVARAAEALGFDSLWVSDHVIVPADTPFIPDDITEPLAVLAYLSGITDRITLATGVLVLPYRNTLFTAKFLSSVDVFSHGRLEVGIGVGRLEGEFEALGVDFASRGAVTDEQIDVFRNLWTTEDSSFSGQFHNYERVRFFPKAAPEREGTIPILVGGTSGRALRRAATRGDGWHPILLLPDELRQGIERYYALCDEAGRPRGKVVYRHLAGYPPSELTGWPFPGNAEQQATALQEYARTGIDEIVFDATVLSEAATDASDVVAELEAFVSNTLPIFRELD